MATVLDQPEAIVAPLPAQNQVDAVGRRSAQDLARRIFNDHKNGLAARRERDLISEKLLLHIDGSGDLQWADILNGQSVVIPRGISEYRKTENLLRLIVDNAVAHHTTMPLHYFADSSPDHRAREKAAIDTIWANYLAHDQDFNGLMAEAMYLAMPAAFTPLHAYWREDVIQDWYEPVEYGADAREDEYGLMQGTRPGMIDCWVGNPFDHVFDRSAKRGSIRWSSYGRVLPADLVRRAFEHIPEARSLEGTTRLPSAALFQRIARSWQMSGLGIHGSAVTTHRKGDEDELLAVICRETPPGVLSRDDPGRLQIIAVPGAVDTRRGEGQGGHAVLLADQSLPGKDFSFSLFYSHHRIDEIHGKPWVEDIDQTQVDLNIALSKRWEHVNKLMDAPIVAPGGAISEDMTDLNGYSMLEVEPSLANWRPRVMEWSQSVLPALDKEVEDRRRSIYTAGGYQASSRGEAPGSRMAYKAIVALQEADRSVHGPVNMRFRRSACDFMRRCWKQMKQYGDVPWLVNITGDEYAHLVEPYIDNTKLSDEPPRYKLVNAFGSSPEMRSQEIQELVQLRGADQQPFLTTAEARRIYPDQMMFDDSGNAESVKRRRAKTVAAQIHLMAKRIREQTGLQETDPSNPHVQQAAYQLFQLLEQQFKRRRDDDLMSNLTTLSEITQDETADPIAREAAAFRQELYFQWQAAMAGVQAPASQDAAVAPGGGGEQGAQASGMGRRAVAAEAQGGGTGGMTL